MNVVEWLLTVRRTRKGMGTRSGANGRALAPAPARGH